MADDRTTSFTDGSNFALKNNLTYIEVSAKTGNNVSLLFENLTRIMVKKEQELDKRRVKKGKIDKSHVTSNKSIQLDNSVREENGNIRKKNDGCCN